MPNLNRKLIWAHCLPMRSRNTQLIEVADYFNGGLVAKVVAAWPKAAGKNLSLLAAGIPCRTFVMNQCNRQRRNHYRSENGNPRSSQSCDTDGLYPDSTLPSQLPASWGLAQPIASHNCLWLSLLIGKPVARLARLFARLFGLECMLQRSLIKG